MTNLIREQILAVRDTGLTNMFDIPTVQRIAFDLGYYELVDWLTDHRKEYVNFIMTGEEYALRQGSQQALLVVKKDVKL